MTLETALSLALFVAFMAYAARRLLVLLHVFQQGEYGRLSFKGRWETWAPWKLHNPCKHAKKPLRMTARAKRVYWLSLVLVPCVFLGHTLLGKPFPAWPAWIMAVAVFVPVAPVFLLFSNLLLRPVERRIQNRYWREGRERLLKLKPVVIGITGSFGKTSVKHILGHILATAAPTLITPGSVNTPMGVTRIIREKLEPRHKYFVVEMGAYGPGSIARLCALAPPDHAIVTAVGPAHLERFGSLEVTAQAKAELAQAAAGTVVVPEDLLAYPAFAALRDRLTLCPPHTVEQTHGGLRVEIDGRVLEAPLYGAHHGDNIALAWALARALGLEAELIAAALRTVPQIAHRLEVGTYATGAALIDDAYNANPAGVRAALDLLDFLAREDGKRRILVTPGVVELGEAHAAEHSALGAYAAPRADVIIAVAAQRIPSFVKAAREAGAVDVMEVARFAEAQAWLAENTGPGDVVLIANDLPDALEG